MINMDANLGEILLVYDTISMAREDLTMLSGVHTVFASLLGDLKDLSMLSALDVHPAITLPWAAPSCREPASLDGKAMLEPGWGWANSPAFDHRWVTPTGHAAFIVSVPVRHWHQLVLRLHL